MMWKMGFFPPSTATTDQKPPENVEKAANNSQKPHNFAGNVSFNRK